MFDYNESEFDFKSTFSTFCNRNSRNSGEIMLVNEVFPIYRKFVFVDKFNNPPPPQ